MLALKLSYFLLFVMAVNGHGHLVDPPNRSSAWRYGFKTPTNYNDMEVWCGGLQVQNQNGGKCGVCGDRWDGSRDHEMPNGKFVKPLAITRSYRSGQEIEVTVKMTAVHRGDFTFKLCPVTNPNVEVAQECLDRRVIRVLNSPTGHQQKYELGTAGSGDFKVRLKLPDGLRCRRCVLQWTYRAGNNWGQCGDGTGRLGCGAQEHFRNCADVRIQ